jgi:hypothetical protein
METVKITKRELPMPYVMTSVNPHAKEYKTILTIEGESSDSGRHLLQFEGYTMPTALALFLEKIAEIYTPMESKTIAEQSASECQTAGEYDDRAAYLHEELTKAGMDLPFTPSDELLEKLFSLFKTATSLRATFDMERRTVCVFKGDEMVFIKRLHPLEDDHDCWFGVCLGGAVYDLNLSFDGGLGYTLSLYLVETDKDGHFCTTDHWYRVELTTQDGNHCC